MRRFVTALITASAATPLTAHEPQSNTGSVPATRTCSMAVDARKAFPTPAAMIVSGGNPVLPPTAGHVPGGSGLGFGR